MWATLNTQRQSWDRSVWSATSCLNCTVGVESLDVFSNLIPAQNLRINPVGLLREKNLLPRLSLCVKLLAALWNLLPPFYCQDVISVTSPRIPPCVRSLCNYRCKLGVCGRLPDFVPPLPVNNTLPTTFHCDSCFCDLMPVSCGGQKGRPTIESHSITQIVETLNI